MFVPAIRIHPAAILFVCVAVQAGPWFAARTGDEHHTEPDHEAPRSADPRHGVVDAACAVHGVPNLFVASSSVFPRGGYANVTLTALALGLRVADRVRRGAAATELVEAP